MTDMATDTLKLFGPNSEKDSEIFGDSTSVLSVYGLNYENSFYISVVIIVQELCESRGGHPGLSVLTSLMVSVDVKLY